MTDAGGSHRPDFERIVPKAPVTAPGAGGKPAARAAGHAAGANIPPALFIGGLLVLLVLGALSFMVLPGLVSKKSASPTPAVAANPAEAAAKQPVQETPAVAEPPAAPVEPAKPIWDDAAMLQARADAQDAKAKLDATIAELSGHAIDRWGAGELAKVQARAVAAEAKFTAKDFPGSRDDYQAALAGSTELLARVPQELAKALGSGSEALARGDKAAATAAFELAGVIEPGNAGARRGLERVASLDAVRGKLDVAATLERANDLPGAAGAFREALKLDPDDPAAKEGLARVGGVLADREFQRVVAEALSALDAGNLTAADAKLARARGLRANDPAVAQAQARLTEARRNNTIAALKTQAAGQVEQENWSAAVTTYQGALQVDPALAFAQAGLSLAQPRAELARQLQDMIDRPERLTSNEVKRDAEGTLAKARAVPSPGPVLQRQIAAAANAISSASRPVRVSLRSDSATEVQVYRIGPLGKFATHDLELQPGRYTAIGTRPGYRDVRRDFEVKPGAASLAVEVRCEEPI